MQLPLPGHPIRNSAIAALLLLAPQWVACSHSAPVRAPSVPQDPRPQTKQELAASAQPVRPLTKTDVATSIQGHHAAFNACQRLGGNSTSTPAGGVTVGWKVNPDGSASSAQVLRSTLDDDQITDCVLSVAENVSFPASGMATEVAWTVRFAGDVASQRLANRAP